MDPPRDRGSTQKQRSRRIKTLQAARAKARKFKGLLGSNKTPWGLGGSSCNGFRTLSRDLTRGRDFVYRWNSLKFQPAIPKFTGVLIWGKTIHSERKRIKGHMSHKQKGHCLLPETAAELLNGAAHFKLQLNHLSRVPQTLTGVDIHPEATQLIIAKGHQCRGSRKTNRS